jgi:hypothetical protein
MVIKKNWSNNLDGIPFFENFQEPKTRTTFFLAIFCINFTWKIVVQPPYFKVGKLFLPKSLKFNDVQVFKAT